MYMKYMKYLYRYKLLFWLISVKFKTKKKVTPIYMNSDFIT